MKYSKTYIDITTGAVHSDNPDLEAAATAILNDIIKEEETAMTTFTLNDETYTVDHRTATTGEPVTVITNPIGNSAVVLESDMQDLLAHHAAPWDPHHASAYCADQFLTQCYGVRRPDARIDRLGRVHLDARNRLAWVTPTLITSDDDPIIMINDDALESPIWEGILDLMDPDVKDLTAREQSVEDRRAFLETYLNLADADLMLADDRRTADYGVDHTKVPQKSHVIGRDSDGSYDIRGLRYGNDPEIDLRLTPEEEMGRTDQTIIIEERKDSYCILEGQQIMRRFLTEQEVKEYLQACYDECKALDEAEEDLEDD